MNGYAPAIETSGGALRIVRIKYDAYEWASKAVQRSWSGVDGSTQQAEVWVPKNVKERDGQETLLYLNTAAWERASRDEDLCQSLPSPEEWGDFPTDYVEVRDAA
jgi:hypothetical protein